MHCLLFVLCLPCQQQACMCFHLCACCIFAQVNLSHKKTQLLPTTWVSHVPIHDATKNIFTRGPFTCTTNRVHCATPCLNHFQLAMQLLLIYQTWTCPSITFVMDQTSNVQESLMDISFPLSGVSSSVGSGSSGSGGRG